MSCARHAGRIRMEEGSVTDGDKSYGQRDCCRTLGRYRQSHPQADQPRQVENRGDEGKQGRRQLRHEQHDSRQRSASAARYPRTAPLVRKPERAIHPSFCCGPCDVQGSLRRGRADRAGKSPAGSHGTGRHPEQRRAGQDGGDGRAGGDAGRDEPDAAALARGIQGARAGGDHGQGGAQGQGAEPDVLPAGAGLHRGADVRQSEVSADAGAGAPAGAGSGIRRKRLQLLRVLRRIGRAAGAQTGGQGEIPHLHHGKRLNDDSGESPCGQPHRGNDG